MRSSTGIHRRTTPHTKDDLVSPEPHRPVVNPIPKPWPMYEVLALGFIIALGFLQFFLPATHFRDPYDPRRIWVPFDSTSPSSSLTLKNSRSSDGGNFIRTKTQCFLHVVSWMECLDLRKIAVLTNSTLSSSRHPELVCFHFFVPGGNEDKLSFYKLKVLFPHSNLAMYGQEEVKAKIMTAVPGLDHGKANMEEIAPFIIPSVHQSLRKFIYISSNVIMKGRVEDLIGVDLNTYGIAAAEDCSRRLSAYVNPDVLDAVQRSATKPWMSETPYAKNACMPALSVLLVDSRKLEKNYAEAVLWWSKVLNLWESITGNRGENGLSV